MDYFRRYLYPLNMVVTLTVGSFLLFLYAKATQFITQLPLYLLAMIFITLGLNQLVFFFEDRIRHLEELKEPITPLAESLIWGVPFGFMLYQFYNAHPVIPRLVSGILACILAFFFVLAFTNALSKTRLAKKKLNITVGFLLLSGLIIGLTYIWQNVEILLFLPLTLVLSYTHYVRSNFIGSDSNSANKAETPSSRVRRYFEFPYRRTALLMLLFLIPFFLYVKDILPFSVTSAGLYQVSLTIYAIILSITTAFAVVILRRQPSVKPGKRLTRALLGLAQMCIVFIVVSLIGILIGADIEASIFSSEMTLTHIFSNPILISSLMKVLVFEAAILSFAPTLIYLYAMLKTFLTQRS